MSWSITFIGSPENVIKAVADHSEKLSDKSKEEYDLALPHISALVAQNKCSNYPMVVKLDASGHGHDGFSNCLVSIQQLAGQLV